MFFYYVFLPYSSESKNKIIITVCYLYVSASEIQNPFYLYASIKMSRGIF